MKLAAIVLALVLSGCATTREVAVGERPDYAGCTRDETGRCAPRQDGRATASVVIGSAAIGR